MNGRNLMVVLLILVLIVWAVESGKKNKAKKKNKKNAKKENGTNGDTAKFGDIETQLSDLKCQLKDLTDRLELHEVILETMAENSDNQTNQTNQTAPQTASTCGCQTGSVIFQPGRFRRTENRDIVFEPPFSKAPGIITGITSLDVKITGSSLSYNLETKFVKTNGASLSLTTWSEITRAKLVWFACPVY